MSNNAKVFSFVLIMMVGLLVLTAAVSATSDLYSIQEVEVGGVVVSTTSVTQVTLDSPTEVEVTILGTGDNITCPDGDVEDCAVEVRISVTIGGYEYGDIEEETSLFDVNPGVTYNKRLYVEIPDDLDVEDDNTYTLRVDIYDRNNNVRQSYDLFLERPRHSVKIQDVQYDHSVEPGQFVPVEVRLENLGDNKEEDIKVEVTIDGLTSDAGYVNELAAFEIDNEDEESSESIDLLLQIPSSATPGDHTVEVTVTYDRGHSSLQWQDTIIVLGTDTTTTTGSSGESEAKVAVTLGTKSITGNAGEGAAFKLTFANLGDSAATYLVNVNGLSQWATTSVSPSIASVSPGSTEEVTVTVTPNDGITGSYRFSVQILDADGNLEQEVDMSMNVDAGDDSTGSTNWLKLAFIVLVVLVILFALIVAFRKLRDDDDDPLEPKDGQAYY